VNGTWLCAQRRHRQRRRLQGRMPDTDVLAAVEGVIDKEASLEDIRQLVANGADVNGLRGNMTPLLHAVQEQRADVVQCLLDCKADPDLADPKGVGPLHMAIFDGMHDVVQSLLDARADVNKRDRHGQTPLFFAPHRKACAQLGAANCDVNAVNSKGQSALHLAAHAGLNDAVLWLAENMKPSTINVQDRHGRTAVYCAAHSNLKSTILLLQEHGADLSLRPHKYSEAKKQKRHDVTGSVKEGDQGSVTSPKDVTARRQWTDESSKPAPLMIDTNKLSLPTSTGEFEVISPKRTASDLRHLQDQLAGPDSEVLSVLASTLQEDGAARQPMPILPFSGYYCAHVRPTAPYLFSLYPQFTKRPTGASAAAKVEQALPPAQLLSPTEPLSPAEPMSPVQLMSPVQAPATTGPPVAEITPFATYYKVNVAPCPTTFFSELHATHFPPSPGAPAAAAEPASPISPFSTTKGYPSTYGLSPKAAVTESAAAPMAKPEPVAAAAAVGGAALGATAVAAAASSDAAPSAAAKATSGKVDFNVSEDTPEGKAYWQKKEEEGAVRIQTLFRGKKTRARVTAKAKADPVPTTDWFGAKVWEVELTKKDGQKQKFGFSHSNAKTDFFKEYVKSHGNAEGAASIAPLPDGPEALIVKKVGEQGLLEEWNFIHEDAQVTTGIRVFQVNDKVTIQDMQKELRKPSVKMKVMQYPENFTIDIEKRPGARKLGFKFEKPANDKLRELKITEVTKDGLLDEANRRRMAEGHHHLCALSGMRIEAANDVSGDGTQIAEELRRCDKVTLKIRRAAAVAQAKLKVQNQIRLLNAFRLK